MTSRDPYDLILATGEPCFTGDTCGCVISGDAGDLILTLEPGDLT